MQGVFGPGQAAVLVDHRDADDLPALLGEREGRDGAGRADLAAGVAGVVAVPEARPEDGRPQALEAGLSERRLQAGRRAHLHALAAAQAVREEPAFVLRARRPDQARVLDGARHAGAEEHGRRHAGAHGDQGRPAAGVVLRPGARPRGAERHPSGGRARDEAVQAHRALGAHDRDGSRGRLDGAGGRDGVDAAGGGAGAAGAAALRRHRAHQLHLGEQSEERAQRAEVAAPEAVRQQVEEDDGEEQQEEGDGLLVARLDGGEDRSPEGVLEPGDDAHRRPPGSCRRAPARRRRRRSPGWRRSSASA